MPLLRSIAISAKNTPYCGGSDTPTPRNCGNDLGGNHQQARKKWRRRPACGSLLRRLAGNHWASRPMRLWAGASPCPTFTNSRRKTIRVLSRLPRAPGRELPDNLHKRKRSSHQKGDWSVCERIAPPLPSRRMLRSPIGYGREAWGARSVFQ